jgi:hypothetical protein
MTGMCQVAINRVVCGEPAEGVWEGGCVHEHATTDIEICGGHRELAGRPFVCIPCERAGCGKCMVQLREVPRG